MLVIGLDVKIWLFLACLAMLSFAAGDYATCIDQNSECQTDCCVRNGGHFDPNSEIDCIGVADYMATCGQPCQDEYEQCMGYGGGSNEEPGSYTPSSGSGSSASGSCCGGGLIIAAGLLGVFCTREN